MKKSKKLIKKSSGPHFSKDSFEIRVSNSLKYDVFFI